MNLDPGQIKQMLSNVQFPVSKSEIVQQLRQRGANDQIISIVDRLPDKTYNSVQDLQSEFSSLGLGGFKI